MVDFKELVRLGAHFGHIKRRLHPKMNRYIWGVRSNVHLFDVSKSAQLIERAAKFLESVAAEGKTILWVGTKKPARAAILEVADKLKMPHVNHRWIGGTLSNFSQVKKSVTKMLHYEDVLSKSEKFPHYTKKELNSLTKMVDRLKKNIGGIKNLNWPIGAIVLVDALKERSALREAATVGIPVVALVDTNSDPSLVDYVIPINDDSARVVKFVIEYLGDAAAKGQKEARVHETKKKEAAAEAKKLKIKAEGEKKAAQKKVSPSFSAKDTPRQSSGQAPDRSPRLRRAGAPEKKVAPKKPFAKPVAKPAVKKAAPKKETVEKKEEAAPKKEKAAPKKAEK